MILRFPTGLYLSVLPTEPGDGGNVTFLVSTTNPPRSVELATAVIPSGIEHRRRAVPVISEVERFAALGELIFTTSQTVASGTGTGRLLFEVGEVLDFEDDAESTLDPMLVGNTDIRHDTNAIDFADLGLTSDEISEISDLAITKYAILLDELANLRQRRSNIELQLSANSKRQRELKKLLAAMDDLDSTLIGDIEVKIQAESDSIDLENAILVEEGNGTAEQSVVVQNSIRDLAQVVR